MKIKMNKDMSSKKIRKNDFISFIGGIHTIQGWDRVKLPDEYSYPYATTYSIY